MSNLCN